MSPAGQNVLVAAGQWRAGLSPWRGALLLAVVLTAVACIFWPTVRELVGLGERSDSRFALAGPAFLTIVWLQRHQLLALPIRPCWPALIGVGALGMLWLLGELVFARILTDVAVIGMVPMAMLAVLGVRWLSSMAFALLFLLFAIPFDQPLVPTLVRWTSDFTFLGLTLSGIPVYREGAYFVIPTGTWSVADACSGTKYLSVCLMLGLLYSWLLYRSPWKRLAFVTGAVVIGVVGNWIRATLTIAIAHASDNALLRDDHSTFGWVLYMVLLIGYGSLGYVFRDRIAADPGNRKKPGGANNGGDRALLQRPRQAIENVWPTQRVAAALMATLALLMVWPIARAALTRQPHAESSVPVVDIADIAPQQGWSRVGASALTWTPHLENPYRTRIQRFEKSGRRVDVFVGLFHRQSSNSKLVGINNRLVAPEQPYWVLSQRGAATAEIAGQPVDVETGTVVGGGTRVLAWRWYWVDGVSTASSVGAKLRQVLTRLRGKEDTSAWIAIYTRADGAADGAADSAAPLLAEFMRDMGDSLDGAMRSSTRPSF